MRVRTLLGAAGAILLAVAGSAWAQQTAGSVRSVPPSTGIGIKPGTYYGFVQYLQVRLDVRADGTGVDQSCHRAYYNNPTQKYGPFNFVLKKDPNGTLSFTLPNGIRYTEIQQLAGGQLAAVRVSADGNPPIKVSFTPGPQNKDLCDY